MGNRSIGPAAAGRDNGVDLSGVWWPYSFGSSERVLAPGAPKSGQRRADYVPVASAQKARQSEPRSTALRNAMPAWQGKARFGRQGAA